MFAKGCLPRRKSSTLHDEWYAGPQFMILAGRHIPRNETLRCDICIVGSGAAGITAALELAQSSFDVILLEAGGFRSERAVQDLYRGEVDRPDRHSPLHLFRSHRVGGTTTLWYGKCLPFDAIDLQERSYVPYSGWPIRAADLSTCYKRAHQYLDIGEDEYEVKNAIHGASAEMIPGFRSDVVRTDTIARYSLPTNFATRYRTDLKAAKNIKHILRASCTKIALEPDGRTVSHIVVRCLDGNRFQVSARQFILAAGGLEVTRLLLASNDVQKREIGNHSGVLGRFYMCHLSGVVSVVSLAGRAEDAIYDFERTRDGVYCRRQLWISESAQRKDEILNFGAWLHFPKIYDPSHGNGVLSAAFFAKPQLPEEYLAELAEDLARNGWNYRLLAQHARNMLVDAPTLLHFVLKWIYKRILSKRKIPQIVLKSPANRYRLYYIAEQAPSPESRVYLSDETDTLGVPRLVVNWRTSELDVRSALTAHGLVQRELKRSRCGHLAFKEGSIEDGIRGSVATAGHHIGTTRMARDPRRGVVDENCRVHNVSNLYIASSSVFPTSGRANPTLTIVALAIRVADRIKKLLK
ncbi:MAG: GMC oxidoreductase [Pyrinomonadaceae bacterium]